MKDSEGLNDFVKGYRVMFGLLFGVLVLQRLFLFPKGESVIYFWILFSGLAILISFYLFLKTFNSWVNWTVRTMFGLPLFAFIVIYGIQNLRVLGFARLQSIFGTILFLTILITLLITKTIINNR